MQLIERKKLFWEVFEKWNKEKMEFIVEHLFIFIIFIIKDFRSIIESQFKYIDTISGEMLLAF